MTAPYSGMYCSQNAVPRLSELFPCSRVTLLRNPEAEVNHNTWKNMERVLSEIQSNAIDGFQKGQENLVALQADVDRMRKCLQELEHEIFVCRAVIAPVRRIPSDVLAVIFSFLVAESPDHVAQVSLVCTQWRKVTLGHPELWPQIIISKQSTAQRKRVAFFTETLYGKIIRPLLTISYSQSTEATRL